MDSPVFVRPGGNGPKGETGTTVKNQKTRGFLRPEGALIPPPQDADQHRMGVEVHYKPLRAIFRHFNPPPEDFTPSSQNSPYGAVRESQGHSGNTLSV